MEELVCCITQDKILEPAVTAFGSVYERSAIEEWLAKSNIDPVTNLALPTKQVNYFNAPNDSESLKALLKKAALIKETTKRYFNSCRIQLQTPDDYEFWLQNKDEIDKYKLENNSKWSEHQVFLEAQLASGGFCYSDIIKSEAENIKFPYFDNLNHPARDNKKNSAQLNFFMSKFWCFAPKFSATSRVSITSAKLMLCYTNSFICSEFENLEIFKRNYKSCKFTGSNIKNTKFWGCDFSRCDFMDTSFENVGFYGCTFIGEEIIFHKARWNNVKFYNCAFEFVDRWVTTKDPEEIISILHARLLDKDHRIAHDDERTVTIKF